MKQIIYYIALLILVGVITGTLVFTSNTDVMAMKQMVGVSGALVLYVALMSLVGEIPSTDERETNHKYVANRIALIVGTLVFTIGIIYQLFVNHSVDYWLLVGLIGINVTKLVALIYLNSRN